MELKEEEKETKEGGKAEGTLRGPGNKLKAKYSARGHVFVCMFVPLRTTIPRTAGPDDEKYG